MSYEDDNASGSDHDFGDLFGSEDEASDIDDGRSQSSNDQPVANATKPSSPPVTSAKSNDLDNLFGSDDESESEEESDKRQTLKQRRFDLEMYARK
jgi:RNA polymerase-associated protein LEO1